MSKGFLKKFILFFKGILRGSEVLLIMFARFKKTSGLIRFCMVFKDL